MKRLSTLFLFAVLIFIFSSCQSAQDDQIFEAQQCLDNARSAADASNCSNILGDITGERANRIRCGIVVLAAGITQDRIVNSFGAIDNSGQDPIVEIGAGLAVGNGPGDVTTAQNIQNVCNLSKSDGLKLVANLILLSTQASNAAVCGANDPTCTKNGIALMSATDVGNFAISTYQIYCEPTFSNTKICTSLQNAGANGSDPNTIGAALKACIATNTCQ